MTTCSATVVWQRNGQTFTDNQYSREHQWRFDGGLEVPASSSPHIVPLPFSVEANVDPEEAFVASLSSCHMLFFLSIAARNGFVVENYTDRATGLLAKDSAGRLAMTKVTLKPDVTWSGDKRPSRKLLEEMHHEAHEKCFIANSVKTEVVTEITEG